MPKRSRGVAQRRIARTSGQSASALDNEMALSDLALAHHFDGVFGWGEDLAQSFVRCGEAARRAVAIDDGDANAHTALSLALASATAAAGERHDVILPVAGASAARLSAAMSGERCGPTT